MSGTPTLYVETNFLVGHARGEAEEYETILSAAEANRIALVVPVFGFYEALSKFGREREDREKWATQLDRLGAELDRKKVNPERSSAFREAADHLRKLVDVHSTGLNETNRRVRACASLVDLGAQQLEDALALEFEILKDVGDRWVCASLRHALTTASAAPSRVFLTTDIDFANTVEEWSTRSTPSTLLAPFAGLKVRKHPAKVVDEFSLSTRA